MQQLRDEGWRHNGCGGKLIQLTQEPVEAGQEGSGYLVFRCEKCGEVVPVGGTKFISKE